LIHKLPNYDDACCLTDSFSLNDEGNLMLT